MRVTRSSACFPAGVLRTRLRQASAFYSSTGVPDPRSARASSFPPFDAATSAFQSSGGLPRSSIRPNNAYASPRRSYIRRDSPSLTHAYTMILSRVRNRKKSRNRPRPNFALNQCFISGPSVPPCRYFDAPGFEGISSKASWSIAASNFAFALPLARSGCFFLSTPTACINLSTWSRNKGCAKSAHPCTSGDGGGGVTPVAFLGPCPPRVRRLEVNLAFDRLVRVELDSDGESADPCDQSSGDDLQPLWSSLDVPREQGDERS